VRFKPGPPVAGLSFRRFGGRSAVCGGCAILVSLLAAACSLFRSQPAAQSFTSKGTLATITVGPESRDRLGQASDEIRAAFRKLESQLSTYQSDSEISQLARKAGNSSLPVSEDTFRVLELSKHYGKLTQGALDVTIAPLVRLWGFGVRPPNNPPEPERIQEQLKLVDYRRIELSARSAFLPAGMSVDLGGIGKGYAVDKGYEILRTLGVNAAMVDLGGNIRVRGQAEPGLNWTIGVRDPFDRDQVLGKIALPSSMAVATSGNYERFVEMGGRRYSHIIDPRTGYPVEGMAAVTVVAPEATMSDALSTGLFVLGMEAGTRVLRALPGAEAVFVPDREPVEIWLTPGMRELFDAGPEFALSLRILNSKPR
jgi:thiamine biosynthesis lipoprotein